MVSPLSANNFAAITLSDKGRLIATLRPSIPAAHLTISSTLTGFVVEASEGSRILVGQEAAQLRRWRVATDI